MSARRFSRVVVTTAVFLALAVGAGARAGAADRAVGIGVMGDSYCDEYQFYPPHRDTARNWVEILAETRGLNFGRFSVVSRGEPRNQGYEYNWARSDATTESLLASGQHTGLAAQVARGEVSIVFVFIGGNDFIHAMQTPDPVGTLRRTLPRAIANYRTAVETVRNASPGVKLVLSTLPDIRDLPEFAVPIREGRIPVAVADEFTAGMREFNGRVRELAASDPNLALSDFERFVRVANLLTPRTVPIAGVQLDRREPSDALGHFWLADQRHPGTLAHSLLARLALEVLNTRFGMNLPPLRDPEVLAFARALSPNDASVGLTGLTVKEAAPAGATASGTPVFERVFRVPQLRPVPERAP